MTDAGKGGRKVISPSDNQSPLKVAAQSLTQEIGPEVRRKDLLKFNGGFLTLFTNDG